MSTAPVGPIPAQRLQAGEKQMVAQAMEDLRFNQPWTYYSTILIPDFKKLDSHVLAFWQDTYGTAGRARTNLAQPGQIPEAFKAYGISIRVCTSFYDNPRIFELLTNWSSISVKVGSDEMIDGPVTQFPAGGGVHGTLEVGAVQIPVNPTPTPSGGADIKAPPAGGGAPSQQAQGPTVVVTDVALIATPASGQPPGPGQMPPTGNPPMGGPMGVPVLPLSILTNGVPHRSNVYQFANDPIRIKKGSNISTELYIDRGAFSELKALPTPLAPGVSVQISLIGRRARSAGYGTGG